MNPRIIGGTVDLGAYESVPPNGAPVADASATPTLFISPNGSTANVVLDGSRSSDADGDPSEYAWLSTLDLRPSTLLATGMVAVVLLPVGTHAIGLVVNDGLAQSTNTVTVTVLTTSEAVQRLVALVNESSLRRQQPLLATQEAALASIRRGNSIAAINQLRAFQNQVRAQVSPTDPILARQLIQGVGQVIEALGRGNTNPAGQPHRRVTSVARQSSGRVRMQFSAEVGGTYLIEASTNLVNWELIGVTAPLPEGQFEFEDAQAAHFLQRFYRIVSP